MKKIGIDNRIFQSGEFQKDKYKFYLIMHNFDSPDLLLYSDEENYVVCRGMEGLPTWIWSRDGISIDKIREIEKVIPYYLTDFEKDKFTCKRELYAALVSDGFEYLNTDDYFEMGFLKCDKTIKPKLCEGKIDVPNGGDKDALTLYCYDAFNEMNGVEPLTFAQASDNTKAMIESNRLYVWRNNDGKIVCMGSYSIVDNLAKISHVYTPSEERGKGYAANLIYSMTNLLLEKGLVPLLYTDYNYIPSNKAYINVGYEDEGVLINFSCSKVKSRKMTSK